MSQTTSSASSDLQFIVILLLLAYLMSSAPSYVRGMRGNGKSVKMEKISPVNEVMKAGRLYAIDPFIRAWQGMRPSFKLAARMVPGFKTSAKMKPVMAQAKSQY